MSFVDAEAIELARQLKAMGTNWSEISRRTGISIEMIRRRIDPGYSQRRHAQNREAGRKQVGKILHVYEGQRLKPAEAEQALASVPLDTRPFFSRLMGDPLPGRSALERRGESNSSGDAEGRFALG